jgi:hypothetical protein
MSASERDIADSEGWTIAAALQEQRLMDLTRQLASGVRLSGSEDEQQAFGFVEAFLKDCGYSVKRWNCEALVGLPGDASLEILGEHSFHIPCNSYSMCPSTPEDGLVAELVDAGRGAPSDYKTLNVAGKIVVTRGLAMPSKARTSDRMGPLAHIHIDDDAVHEMCLSSVWGTPTPETAAHLPKTPAIGIKRSDGDRLLQVMRPGKISARVTTNTYRDWREIPVLTADLEGVDSRDFVLFSGHIDSWHFGAMDNASANAVQLAVAELIAPRAQELRRGLRLAFWSGHSHARYAGSCWYADENWQELHDHCVCHVNADSLGAKGANVLGATPTMAETFGFAAEFIRRVTGEDLEYRRITRSSDQSFWGIGIPSLFTTFSEQEKTGSATEAAHADLLGGSNRGGGLGWWWHTPEDTMDKLDAQNLRRDAGVYAAVIWELCSRTVLPFDYSATVREMQHALSVRGANVMDVLGLNRLEEALRLLHERLVGRTSKEGGGSDSENAKLIALGRVLIPVNYTVAGPFEQDFALESGALPGLAGARRLLELDRASSEYRFLKTRLIRERNRILAGVCEAIALLEN